MNIDIIKEKFFTDKPSIEQLWKGHYKIPWNDPDFSKRMLREHLSQDHNLASRKKEIINKQVEWIHTKLCGSASKKILDLGCGPGFYINEFASKGYQCTGIDFSPASIEYANINKAYSNTEFIQGNLLKINFGSSYDIITFIFGEINVFSPNDCIHILQKAYDSLLSGGTFLLEVHTFEIIKEAAFLPNSWYKSETGLFSPYPHICLIENHWFEKENTSFQQFYVFDLHDDILNTYISTTKAWTNKEYQKLLEDAGFVNVTFHTDWPVHDDSLFAITAQKL